MVINEKSSSFEAHSPSVPVPHPRSNLRSRLSMFSIVRIVLAIGLLWYLFANTSKSPSASVCDTLFSTGTDGGHALAPFGIESVFVLRTMTSHLNSGRSRFLNQDAELIDDVAVEVIEIHTSKSSAEESFSIKTTREKSRSMIKGSGYVDEVTAYQAILNTITTSSHTEWTRSLILVDDGVSHISRRIRKVISSQETSSEVVATQLEELLRHVLFTSCQPHQSHGHAHGRSSRSPPMPCEHRQSLRSKDDLADLIILTSPSSTRDLGIDDGVGSSEPTQFRETSASRTEKTSKGETVELSALRRDPILRSPHRTHVEGLRKGREHRKSIERVTTGYIVTANGAKTMGRVIAEAEMPLQEIVQQSEGREGGAVRDQPDGGAVKWGVDTLMSSFCAISEASCSHLPLRLRKR